MATPVVMAIGKETSNPFIFNDSPLTGVSTPGCDENSMKLICFDVPLVICCCKDMAFQSFFIIEMFFGFFAVAVVRVQSSGAV